MFTVSWAPQTNVHSSPLHWGGGRNVGDWEQIKNKIVCIADVFFVMWTLSGHFIGSTFHRLTQPVLPRSALMTKLILSDSRRIGVNLVIFSSTEVSPIARHKQSRILTTPLGIKARAGCVNLTSVTTTLINVHIFNSDIGKISFVKAGFLTEWLHEAVKANPVEWPMSMYSVYCAMCVVTQGWPTTV